MKLNFKKNLCVFFMLFACLEVGSLRAENSSTPGEKLDQFIDDADKAGKKTKEKAEEVVEEVKDKAEEAKEKAKEAHEKAKEKAHEAIDNA